MISVPAIVGTIDPSLPWIFMPLRDDKDHKAIKDVNSATDP